jgi:hypothetical protein
VALSRELQALAKGINSSWVMRAIAGFDELYAGARRNLNRQLGLDALARFARAQRAAAAIGNALVKATSCATSSVLFLLQL